MRAAHTEVVGSIYIMVGTVARNTVIRSIGLRGDFFFGKKKLRTLSDPVQFNSTAFAQVGS